MDTDSFIELLINDDTEQLDKLYILPNWENTIDFDKVYDSVNEINNPSVHNILGVIHYRFRDRGKALYYFELSAEKGNSWGQFNIGHIISDTFSLRGRYEEILHYIQLSAEQGNSFAQNHLGVMYRRGLGVPQDHEKAFHYYQLSAQQGNETSMINLRVLIGIWGDGFVEFMIKKSQETDKEISELRERNKQLEEENTELKYRPDGVGYLEAKEHFTALKN